MSVGLLLVGTNAAAGCVGDPAAAPDAPDAGTPSDGATSSDTGSDGGGGSDSSTDAGPRCDPNKAFANKRLLPNINAAGTANEGARLTADEKTVYFSRFTGDGGPGGWDVFVATRPTAQDPFSVALPLNGGNTLSDDRWPTVTADGFSIYVSGPGTSDVLSASRATTGDPFSSFALSPLVSSANNDEEAFVLPDHSALYFTSDRPGTGGFDLYRAPHAGGVFQAPVEVAGTNTGADELFPTVTSNERTIYFASNRAPTVGTYDVYSATRSSTSSAFGTAQAITPLNSTGKDFPNWVSDDDCVIVWTSDISGSYKVYVAERPK